MPAATPPTQPRPPSLTAPPPRWRPSARSDRRHRPVADTPRPGRRPAPVAERSPAGDGAGPPWQRAARQMAGGEGGGERPPLGSKSPGLTLTLIPTPILPGAGLCSANSQWRVKTRGVGGKTRDGADGDEDGHGHPPHPCHVRHVGEIWAEKDTGL